MLEVVRLDIQSVASLIGLELALVTLFTSELARRLADERKREGGSEAQSLTQIRRLSAALLAITVLSILAVTPLWIQAVQEIAHLDATVSVFLLTALLLIPLAAWQYSIAAYKRKT